jgi:uncharacterized membrane protein
VTTPIPRTIAEYLDQLRAALHGADPALIQDALYDAEEHLRGELRDNPGKSEAEVIAKIVGSYGAPEEVAEIYIDKEAQVQQAFRSPPPPPRETALGRFFAVGADAQAYAGLFYMLLSLATGIFYFTWTVAGLALSVGLSPLIVGILFALLFFGTTRVLAQVESRIIETMLGERMPRRPIYAPPNQSIWRRIGAMLTDPRTWSTLLYFVLMLPLGIAYFTTAIVGIVLSLSFIFVSLFRLFAWVGLLPWSFASHINTGIVPGIIATPVLFVLGIALLFGLLHLARGVAKFQGGLAKGLLVR